MIVTVRGHSAPPCSFGEVHQIGVFEVYDMILQVYQNMGP